MKSVFKSGTVLGGLLLALSAAPVFAQAQGIPKCPLPAYSTSGNEQAEFIMSTLGTRDLIIASGVMRFIQNVFNFRNESRLSGCQISEAWKKAAEASLALMKSAPDDFETLGCIGLKNVSGIIRIGAESNQGLTIVEGSHYNLPLNGDYAGALSAVTKVMNTQNAMTRLYWPLCGKGPA